MKQEEKNAKLYLRYQMTIQQYMFLCRVFTFTAFQYGITVKNHVRFQTSLIHQPVNYLLMVSR